MVRKARRKRLQAAVLSFFALSCCRRIWRVMAGVMLVTGVAGRELPGRTIGLPGPDFLRFSSVIAVGVMP